MRDQGLSYRLEDWARVPTAVLVWAEGDDVPDLEDVASQLKALLEPGERVDVVYSYTMAAMREALGQPVRDIASAKA